VKPMLDTVENDEARMTKDEGMTKSELIWPSVYSRWSVISQTAFVILSFGFDSSFVIGHSSFIA